MDLLEQEPLFFFSFDAVHWQRVQAAREAQGRNRLSDQCKQRPQHPLVEATLRQLETGKLWRVRAVRQEWQRGNYLVATLECEGVERECVVENLSSCEAHVNIELARYKKGFQVLTRSGATAAVQT